MIQFKDIPIDLYYQSEKTVNPNLLVIHIQPEEGIILHLNAKKSGRGTEATPVKLNYSNKGIDGLNTPEAYEKLLFDSLRGDATNFTHWMKLPCHGASLIIFQQYGKTRKNQTSLTTHPAPWVLTQQISC